jgi:hypothetical protein
MSEVKLSDWNLVVDAPRAELAHEIFTNPDPSNRIMLLRDWFAASRDDGPDVAAGSFNSRPFSPHGQKITDSALTPGSC